MTERLDEWDAYYDEFGPHFTRAKVRDGCQPRFRTRANARGSVVLVHGLSDSPHYMLDIADYIYDRHEYNVLLPLLHCHGLKKPHGMEGVELEEWKRNVSWAVDQAYKLTPDKVSIGGLSTGGALSFYTACISPKVTGDLLLFSAALDLIVKTIGPLGDVLERVLRSKRLIDFLDQLDKDKPLVGDNPYKYSYVDKDGARELVRLIKEIDVLIMNYDSRNPFPKRVFAAHSEADEVANIDGIINLQRRSAGATFGEFYIKKSLLVGHGGLVLNHDVIGHSGAVCTEKNPVFEQMMLALSEFLGD